MRVNLGTVDCVQNNVLGAPRPLAGIALVYVTGCLLAFHAAVPFAALCTAAALAITTSWLFSRRKSRIGNLPLWSACLLLGWMSGITVVSGRDRYRSPLAVPSSRMETELTGRISYDTEFIATKSSGNGRYSFPLKVESLTIDGVRQAVRYRVQVTMSNVSKYNALRYGDIISARGMLVMREHRSSALSSHYDGYFYVEENESHLLARNRGSMLLMACLRIRRAAERVFSGGLSRYPVHAALLRALLLGYRHGLPEDLVERFRITGTVHVLALSGLHVGFICILIAFILRILAVPRTHWFYYMLPLLLIYMLGTGLRSSAVRACMMALCYWAAPAFGRRPDAMTALSAAALLIVFVDPAQAANPGFQYSFLIVGALIMAQPVISRYCAQYCGEDPWRLPQQGNFLFRLRRRMNPVISLGAASCTAWLVSFPLTMYYGNLFVPIALLGNLLVLPLTSLIVGTGALTLLLAPFGVFTVEAFNHANRVFICLLFRIIEVMATVPGGHIFVRSPPGWAVLLFYLGAGLFVFLPGKCRWLSLLAVVVFLGAVIPWEGSRELEVKVSPLGRTYTALVRIPHCAPLLINSGSANYSRRVRSFLRQEGVNRIGALLLTQIDNAHAGMAVKLINERRIDELWIPYTDSYSPVYPGLLAAAKHRKMPVRYLREGDIIELSANTRVRVFHPPPATRSHGAALVFQIEHDEYAVGFGGQLRQLDLNFALWDRIASVWLADSWPEVSANRMNDDRRISRILVATRQEGNSNYHVFQDNVLHALQAGRVEIDPIVTNIELRGVNNRDDQPVP